MKNAFGFVCCLLLTFLAGIVIGIAWYPDTVPGKKLIADSITLGMKRQHCIELVSEYDPATGNCIAIQIVEEHK